MGYDMQFRDGGGDAGYFRLNIWGMGRYREYMADRGMVFDAGESPEWPEFDWDLIERAESPEYFKDEPDLTAEQEASAKAMIATRDELLSWHGPEVPGIPVHKFGSNDGWIVTPAECEAAYRIGKDKPAPEGDADAQQYWAKWLDYLHRAASHGGFEVH